MTQVEMLVREHKVLESQMGEQRAYWQDVADFCNPRKAWITTPRTPGQRLNFNHLYDSHAIRSLKIMAAGFHSNLTNPSSKWFGFQTRNRRFMENREVQLWFNEVDEIIYTIINNTNLDTVAQEFYIDYGLFGTACIFSNPHPKNKVNFMSIPIEQLTVEEDADGYINKVYRKFKLTAGQAYGMWGEKAGEAVLDLIKDNKHQESLEFLHYVGPRDKRNPSKIDRYNMPFKSCWVSLKGSHLIEEGGFEEMPYHIARFWKDPSSPWGYGPAMDVLADVKLIQAQKRAALRRAMKEADPPLQVPNKGYILPLNLNPAAINYRDPNTNADSLQPIGVGAGQFSITREMMELTIDAIKEGFYVPLFQALTQLDKQMTIPEVQRRIMENMVLLGPVVGRVTNEAWSPCLLRVFAIAFRAGLIPPPPPELQDQEMDIVYLSPLAKAQRESDMTSIQAWLADTAAVAAYKPAALDLIGEDKIVRKIAKIRGIDPDLMNDEETVQAVRAERAQAQQAAMQADMAHKAAAIAETTGKADKAFADSRRG